MPAASGAGGGKKYSWMDHDPAYLEQHPAQNTWYTVLEDEDFRGKIFAVMQYNDDMDNMTLEVRWTLDGNVYLRSMTIPYNTQYYIYKNKYPSTETNSIVETTDFENMVEGGQEKFALSAKLEIRMTSAPFGAGDLLYAWCLYETLEET